MFFECENNPANEVVATFFDTDPPAVRLERGDRTIIAWLVPSGSGAKYEGRNVTFWSKGSDTLVTWLGTEMKCQAKGGPARSVGAESIRRRPRVVVR